MTSNQARALRFLERFWAENGYAPSLEEIAAHVGVSTRAAAWRMMDALVRRKLVLRHPHVPRGLVPASVVRDGRFVTLDESEMAGAPGKGLRKPAALEEGEEEENAA